MRRKTKCQKQHFFLNITKYLFYEQVLWIDFEVYTIDGVF